MSIDLNKYIDAFSRGIANVGKNFTTDDESPDVKGKGDLIKYNPYLAKIAIVVVIFVVGFAAGVMLERSMSMPEGDVVLAQEESAEDALKNELIGEVETESQPMQQSEQKTVEEPKAQTTPTPVVAQSSAKSFDSLTAEEQNDVKCLKADDVWSSSKVKSQRFKNMFAQLNSGNIDCLDATFNGYSKEHINGYVVNVISSIKKLTPEEREKAKKYLREDDGGEIKMSWAAKKIGEMAKN